MDVQMPIMDGNEVTARLREYEARENLPRTTVLGLTAHALTHEKESSLAAGMDGYITKPIDARTIKAAFGKYLNANG
jgi:CheY-like chemotaxis protein